MTAQQFTVRFYQYSGASSPISTVKVNGGSIPTAPSTSLTGWTFDSWNNKWNGKGSTEFGQPVMEDVDYCASWKSTLNAVVDIGSGSNTSNSWNSTKKTVSSPGQSGYCYKFFDNWTLPVGAEVTADLDDAAITHKASPVNHYIKLGFCIVPAIGTMNATTTRNAVDSAEDAAEWEVITAPQEEGAGGSDTFHVSAGACTINSIISGAKYLVFTANKLKAADAEKYDEIESAGSCTAAWNVDATVSLALY